MATINPFQGPINYSVDVQSPFEAALGGFKLGAGVSEIQAAQQKRLLEQQALERAQTAQTELQNLFKNPNATSADYARVAAFLPKDQAAIVTQGFEAQTKEQQQNTLRSGVQVYTAIKSGNLPVAEMRLKEQAEGLRNAGKEKEAQGYDDLSNLIRLNPTGAQTTIALTIAGLPGGKDFLDNADKALSTMRAEALAPEVLREQKAKTDKAVQDAQNAVDTAPDDVAKAAAQRKLEEEKAKQEAIKTQIAEATQADEQARIIAVAEKARSDAEKAVAEKEKAVLEAADTPARLLAEQELRVAQAKEAKIKSDFEEQKQQDEIKKRAAELGLTKAQTNEVLAKTRKLDLETKKAALELEAFKRTGGVDPAKIFEQEEKIRKEYQARTKVYGEVQTIFSNIQASAQAKTGPGDIALITGFMKMLDPGSVVRETEFATARDTAGLFESLKNDAQKLESGQLFALNSTQRQQYVNLAQQYLNASKKKADQDKKDLRVVVDNYKLNPDNVFGPQGGGRGDVNKIIPPQAAIDFLRKDPSRAAEFEKKYGPGSASQYLQAR